MLQRGVLQIKLLAPVKPKKKKVLVLKTSDCGPVSTGLFPRPE